MELAFIPVYIKYMGIEAFGLIGLFAVLQAWLALLDMGLAPTLAREMARYTGGDRSTQSIRDLLRSVEALAIIIALLIAGGVVLGSNWIVTVWLNTGALPTQVVVHAFAIMGIVAALRFIESIYRSAMVGLQCQVPYNIVKSIMATFRGLGVVGILVWVSPTIEAFFYWQAAMSVITVAIFIRLTYVNLPEASLGGRLSLQELRGVWRFAGGVAGITVLALVLTQVDKILLSNLLTIGEFGYYALAYTLASGLYVLIGPITQAFYPKFCELHAQKQKILLAQNYHKGAQFVSVIAGSAAAVLMFFSETFLKLWTQDDSLAEQVSPLLRLLVLGNLLHGLMYIPYQMQLAHAWTSISIYTNSIAVLFIIPAIIWSVPRYGTIGAAWVWVMLASGYCLVAVHFFYRRIMTKEKWHWYIKDVFLPLSAAVLSVGLVKVIWPEQNTVFSQSAVLVVASVIALTFSILVARHARQQVFYIVDSYIKRNSQIVA